MYALIVHLASDRRIRIGKLDDHQFKRGYYIYVGSAFGPGGLGARIKHHTGKTSRPHWHIDYLRRIAIIQEVWYSNTENRLEHHWAAAMAKMPYTKIPVKGFGSSDCRCKSHLFYISKKPNIRIFNNNLKNNTKNEQKYRIDSFSDFLSAV